MPCLTHFKFMYLMRIFRKPNFYFYLNLFKMYSDYNCVLCKSTNPDFVILNRDLNKLKC